MKSYRVPLQLLNSQHLAVKARVNGEKAILLVDTGASNTCIDTNYQQQLKLQVQDFHQRGTGAGGGNLQLWLSRNNLLQLRHFKKPDCAVLLMDLSPVNAALLAHDLPAIQGVLGADFLVEYQAKIDYRSLEMELITDCK